MNTKNGYQIGRTTFTGIFRVAQHEAVTAMRNGQFACKIDRLYFICENKKSEIATMKVLAASLNSTIVRVRESDEAIYDMPPGV